MRTAQVHDLFHQQRGFYKDSLQKQECTYLRKGFVQGFKEICDIKASLKYIRKDVNELKSLSDKFNVNSWTMTSNLRNMNGKADYLENQSYRNESDLEKWSDWGEQKN